MWADAVLPRLAARGVGADLDVRTLRLHGIGESQVAEELGEALLRATNPVVATYARHEAVDVRISARAAGGRPAAGARGRGGGRRDGDPRAVRLGARHHDLGGGHRRGARGARLDARHHGAGHRRRAGGPAPGPPGAPPRRGPPRRRRDAAAGRDRKAEHEAAIADAQRVRAAAGADVGFAIRAVPREVDTRVIIGRRDARRHPRRRAARVPAGRPGADRAAIAGAAVLLDSSGPPA